MFETEIIWFLSFAFILSRQFLIKVEVHLPREAMIW